MGTEEALLVRVPWKSFSSVSALVWKDLLAVSEARRTRFSALSEFGEGSATGAAPARRRAG